ncbi:UNVERIFIED_CONTAM: hypothetical protein FKN15_067503, partial [Acipenser sinensis]
ALTEAMSEALQLPALHLQAPGDCSSNGSAALTGTVAWSSSSTPTLRRKRFKMRRMKNVLSEKEQLGNGELRRGCSGSKEYLQLPSIEITPSSDEEAPWSNCSTPSASPRRKRFLLKKWLKIDSEKFPDFPVVTVLAAYGKHRAALVGHHIASVVVMTISQVSGSSCTITTSVSLKGPEICIVVVVVLVVVVVVLVVLVVVVVVVGGGGGGGVVVENEVIGHQTAWSDPLDPIHALQKGGGTFCTWNSKRAHTSRAVNKTCFLINCTAQRSAEECTLALILMLMMPIDEVMPSPRPSAVHKDVT